MSAPHLEDLIVRPGEPVWPAWERLKRWAQTLQLIKGDARVHFTQNYGRGTWVTVRADEATFVPRFHVAVSGLTAVVGLGFLNKVGIPSLGGVPLDGIKDGREVPVTPLALGGHDENRRSWVCLRVKVDLPTGLIPGDDDTALTVVHVTSLRPPVLDGGVADDGEWTGLQPLAMLKWSEDGASIRSVYQITMHNLEHRYVKADPQLGRPGRHFFWAV